MTMVLDKPGFWSPGIDWSHWLFKTNHLRDPPMHNLVGAWILNDGAGSVPVDVGPQGHRGVLTDPTLWRAGEGILFDGTEHIDVPGRSYGFNYPLDASTSGEMTLIVNCRFSGGSQTIFEASSGSLLDGWAVYSTAADLRFETRKDPTGFDALDWTHGGYPLEGTFITTGHIETGAVDKRLYHNGALVASGSVSHNLKANITNAATIASIGLGLWELNGIVRFAIVLNTALSHEEAVAISADPMAPFRKPTRSPAALWPAVVEYTFHGPGWTWEAGPTAAVHYLEVDGKVISGAPKARLWDVTAGAAVAGSELTITGADFGTPNRSGAISLVSGNVYRLQAGSNNADSGEILGGQIASFPA